MAIISKRIPGASSERSALACAIPTLRPEDYYDRAILGSPGDSLTVFDEDWGDVMLARMRLGRQNVDQDELGY
jgi:hypothetical protein